jgi:predicted MarR family transcription regulator
MDNARRSKPDSRHELQAKAEMAERSAAMTQFELALVVAGNAFAQWVGRCGAAAGAPSLGSLDLLVLHMVNYREREKRLADISFALKIEDGHTVAYALKKLAKAGLVTSGKSGKETLFSTTAEGAKLCARYYEIRREFLIQAISSVADEDLDMNKLAGLLRVISGLYEQAARNAATLA